MINIGDNKTYIIIRMAYIIGLYTNVFPRGFHPILNYYNENREKGSEELQRNDMIRARPGDAFIFNGSIMHRGQGNSGYSHRFFYYASFSCRNDVNADTL